VRILGLIALILVGVGTGLLLCGFVFERLTFRRDARSYRRLGSKVGVGGCLLHLRRMGEGWPTVLIAIGGAQPAVTWDPIQRAIAEFTRACCYDRSGIGWSGKARTKCTVENGVAELHRLLLETAEKEPLVLVGHSYGGLLVRAFAHRYPELVAGVVLVDSTEENFITRPEFLPMWKAARWPVFWRALAAQCGGMYVRMALRPSEAALPAGFSPAARAEFKTLVSHQRYWSGTLREVGSLFEPQERRFLKAEAARATLGDLPLIVLSAALPVPREAPQFKAAGAMSPELFDTLHAESQRRLARLSSRAQLIVASRSGHSINFDEPQLVVEAVRRMVEDIRSALSKPLAKS
jgi:pimeloyl-ACP methyl ester carboxylesterase